MTTYAWPDFGIVRFEMRVEPNVRVFPNPFTGSAQVINLTGEHWLISLTTTQGRTRLEGGQLEAFFDRLIGPVHRAELWNLRRPTPLGTLRDGVSISVVNGVGTNIGVVNGSSVSIGAVSGTPVVDAAIDADSGTASLRMVPGYTVEAGDMLGLGTHLARAMAAATADVNGLMSLEFQPRTREDIANGTQIVWNRPKATFMLKGEGVPLTWQPGGHQGASADFVETP